MILIIAAILLILAIAYYQTVQGLFSALIMTVLTVLCALLAFTYYEPLAMMLYDRMPGFAHMASLLALFVLPLLGLRMAFDRGIGRNVILGVWPDRIVGGGLGLISGVVLIGVLAICMEMLPFDASILTYRSHDMKLQREQNLLADSFVNGTVSVLSKTALGTGKPFEIVHDDFLLENFCFRNTAGAHGRTNAPSDSLKVLDVYKPTPDQIPDIVSIPDNPLLDETTLQNTLIVRCAIDESARDEDNWWRLVGTHFRLLTQDGNSYYPVGYLTALKEQGQRRNKPRKITEASWKFHTVEEDGELVMGKILAPKEYLKDDTRVVIDWVFRVRQDDTIADPKKSRRSFMVFRRGAVDRLSKPQDDWAEKPDSENEDVMTRRE